MGRKSLVEIVEEVSARFRHERYARGVKDGRVLGPRTMILRQLRQRFGSLAPGVVTRVETGSTADLEDWSERLLDAPTLESIFGVYEDGRGHGRLEGMRTALAQVINWRWGFSDQPVLERIDAATADELVLALERVLDGWKPGELFEKR